MTPFHAWMLLKADGSIFAIYNHRTKAGWRWARDTYGVKKVIRVMITEVTARDGYTFLPKHNKPRAGAWFKPLRKP